MTDTSVTESTIEPITSSADGKRNSFTLYCNARGQTMNYAACLWRQNVLSAPDIKTPEDWNVCKTACKDGQCKAITMREEEVIAGKSIYFQARELVRKAADAVRQWAMPTGYGTKTTGTVKAKPKATSALDAIGDAGDLADAISAAAREPITVTKPAAHEPTVLTGVTGGIQPPTALPGESPLQMARRMAAARSANGNA